VDNRILRNSFISGGLFGAFLGLLSLNWLIFIISGVIFGGAMGLFAYFVARRAEPVRQRLMKQERMIRSGLANHLVGPEGVGGILFLTDKQLLHYPHAINFQRVLMSYPLDFIEHAEPRLTWKVIPNGLLVTLGDGTEERFVVNGRKAWAKAINGQLKDRKKQTSLQ
jgi:hypothetical protein